MDGYYFFKIREEIAYDESNAIEIFRHEVIMDVAFTNDFAF